MLYFGTPKKRDNEVKYTLLIFTYFTYFTYFTKGYKFLIFHSEILKNAFRFSNVPKNHAYALSVHESPAFREWVESGLEFSHNFSIAVYCIIGTAVYLGMS